MQKNDGHAAPQHSHHHIYCVIDGSYPLRPAAGKCCRSFCYACFLSCISLLLCLTHISRFAHYPSISVRVQAVVLRDMNGRQMPVSPLAISSSVPLGLMSMG